jgi:hypothetical protein
VGDVRKTPPHNARQRYQLERLKIGFYVVLGVWVVVFTPAVYLFRLPAFIVGVAFGLLASVVEAAWEMRIVHGAGWWRGLPRED